MQASEPTSNGIASVERGNVLRNPWAWFLLIAGTCAYGCLTLFFSWSVFDEGFIAKGGELVLRGKLLIRDFLTLYGPAQFYLLAAMYELFGVQLLVVRLWSIAVAGLFGLGLYLIAARVSGNSRQCGTAAMAVSLLLLVYRVPSAGYPMVPAAALLVAAALPLHTFATNGQRKYLGLASLLIGCAALFRWEQGVFGLVALATALAFWMRISQHQTAKDMVVTITWGFAPATALIAVVYAPLIWAAGIGNFIEDVLVHSFRDFPLYRGISFVRPQIWSTLRAIEANRLGEAAMLATPLVAIGLAMLAVVATLGKALLLGRPGAVKRQTADTRHLALAIFISIVVIGLMNQMRIRPDASRGMLVAAASTPLFAYWWHVCFTQARASWRTVGTVSLALLTACLAVGSARSIHGLVQGREIVRNASPHGQHIYNGIQAREYNDLIRHIIEQTRPGEVIFSGVTNHQLLFVNDAMLYFLSGRDGPTRFYEMDPGLANTEQAQQHIADQLEKSAVRLLVLWDLQSTEDNLSSRPNGIDTLDQYIRGKYTLRTAFGNYQVWMRK